MQAKKKTIEVHKKHTTINPILDTELSPSRRLHAPVFALPSSRDRHAAVLFSARRQRLHDAPMSSRTAAISCHLTLVGGVRDQGRRLH